MTDLALTWHPTPVVRQLSSVIVLALVAALATGRSDLVALAAPAVLALVWLRAGPPQAEHVGIGTSISAERCFEGEEISVRVELHTDQRVEQIEAALVSTARLAVTPVGSVCALSRDTVSVEWNVCPLRWGRLPVGPLRITCLGRHRGEQSVVHHELGWLAVFPRPSGLGSRLSLQDLPDRVGDHVSRLRGDGVEFAGVRPYSGGDRARRVNWPVSTRRDQLFVTEFAAERAMDVVAVIDAFADVGPPGLSTVDLAVRGATGIVRSALDRGDRAGVITIGGGLRWLAPDIGARQFFRVVESVLDMRRYASVVTPRLTRIPPVGLPRGSLLVVFSPLLDDRTMAVLSDLRRRRFRVVVIDVLGIEPRIDRRSDIDRSALSLWRIARRGGALRLADLGIPVVSWDGSVELDEALTGLSGRPLDAERR